MQNYKGEGNVVTVAAGGNYDSGDLYLLEDRAGVVQHDVASGDDAEILLEGEVRVPKHTVSTAIGQKMYAHASNGATTSSSSAKALGWATEVTTSADTEVNVKLGAF